MIYSIKMDVSVGLMPYGISRGGNKKIGGIIFKNIKNDGMSGSKIGRNSKIKKDSTSDRVNVTNKNN